MSQECIREEMISKGQMTNETIYWIYDGLNIGLCETQPNGPVGLGQKRVTAALRKNTVAQELVPPRKLKQSRTSLKAWTWEAVNSGSILLHEARTKAQAS